MNIYREMQKPKTINACLDIALGGLNKRFMEVFKGMTSHGTTGQGSVAVSLGRGQLLSYQGARENNLGIFLAMQEADVDAIAKHTGIAEPLANMAAALVDAEETGGFYDDNYAKPGATEDQAELERRIQQVLIEEGYLRADQKVTAFMTLHGFTDGREEIPVSIMAVYLR